MADTAYAKLEQEITEELALELSGEPTYSENVLALKVRNAIREVKMKRNYSATSYTDAQIAEDLYNYFSVIRDLAMYDFAHIGAPGESRRSENSTDRTWVDRDNLLKGVHAFVKVL